MLYMIDVRNAGGILSEEEATVDGNLVTGTGPDAMPKMFEYIKNLLNRKH